MTSQRKSLLLGLVVVLVVLRFVVVPVYQWQQEAIASNERLASNLEKSRRLLEDQGAQERIERLRERVQSLEAKLPSGITDLDLQVRVNTMLENSLEQAGLREISRAWSFGDQTPRLAELRLAVRGHFYDVVQWLHKMETREQPLRVAELQINQTGGSRSGEVNAILVLRQWVLPQPSTGEASTDG